MDEQRDRAQARLDETPRQIACAEPTPVYPQKGVGSDPSTVASLSAVQRPDQELQSDFVIRIATLQGAKQNIEDRIADIEIDPRHSSRIVM